MPILDVTVVLRDGEMLSEGIAAAIADAASAVFGAAPGRTWVRVTSIERAMYAEDGGGPPDGVAPVFASILKARLEDRRDLSLEAEALAVAIGAAVGRPPENVHVLYEPPGVGRIALGGQLVLE